MAGHAVQTWPDDGGHVAPEPWSDDGLQSPRDASEPPPACLSRLDWDGQTPCLRQPGELHWTSRRL
jgi:hypothetical protein